MRKYGGFALCFIVGLIWQYFGVRFMPQWEVYLFAFFIGAFVELGWILLTQGE